ncbi:MAG TPA: carbohydrate kinase [bacterium]
MKRRPQRVVVIGEVLCDVFPDGDRLGGAPFNFAWHLHGLGLVPHFVSRVGDDPRGEQIRAAMAGHGMALDGLQRDPTHPTGTVRVTLDGRGGHHFDILADQAYDHLDPQAVATVMGAAPVDLLYFGTLAGRSPASRAAILTAANATPAIRFLDVNLRPACWSEATLTACLAAATVAKLNDDELEVVRDLYALPAGEANAARALRERFGLDALILTRGARGATWLDGAGSVDTVAPAVEVVDTVGAGDGFAAVAAVGLLHGWPPATTLGRAVTFAARICGRRGACPEDPAFYGGWRRDWGLEETP